MSALANQTASELAQNTSSALNKTGESLQGMGKNVTEAGKSLLNKTEEAAKKIGEGAAGALGNLTGEIKQGLSGNRSQ